MTRCRASAVHRGARRRPAAARADEAACSASSSARRSGSSTGRRRARRSTSRRSRWSAPYAASSPGICARTARICCRRCSRTCSPGWSPTRSRPARPLEHRRGARLRAPGRDPRPEVERQAGAGTATRGRHGLPASVVARSQRTRILRGTAEVMLDKGYANATVATSSPPQGSPRGLLPALRRQAGRVPGGPAVSDPVHPRYVRGLLLRRGGVAGAGLERPENAARG